MADPLTPEQAKAALRDVARGRSVTRQLTTEEAKKRLSNATHRPNLMSLARTQPLLAVTMALGYGFTLAGHETQPESFLAIIDRTLNISMQKRTGT